MNERRISIARTYDELIHGLRQRADELKVSRETIDAVSGLQSGYAGKLLAPVPIRTLSRTSLGAMLGALGVMLIMVEDTEALKRIEKRLSKRRRKTVHTHDAILTTKRKRRRTHLRGDSAWGKLMSCRRVSILPPEKRQQIARRAIRVRWANARRKTKQANEPTPAA